MCAVIFNLRFMEHHMGFFNLSKIALAIWLFFAIMLFVTVMFIDEKGFRDGYYTTEQYSDACS